MKKKNNIVCIVSILIVAFVAMLPMFMTSYKSSHDTKFHLANIVSITENIKNTGLPGKIVGNIANDFGYGTNLFYPPLAHNSIAYLNAVINNPIISIEIFYYIILALSGITMFFLAKKVSKSWEIGLVSATIYMLFPYHISNIYIRDAQNEALLFVFLPMIISGLYDLYKNKNKSFYILFTIGYIGGMLSHLTLMVYFTVLILVLMIINFKETIKRIKPLIISSLFILMITSPFLIPLLEQNILGNYRVFQNGVMVQGTWGHALSIFDYLNSMTTLKSGNIKYFIDIITLLLLIITLVKYKKLNNKFYNSILIFGIISLILSTKLFPWDILPKSIRIMQFPWRFETFVALSISLIAPLCMMLMKDKRVLAFSLTVLILLLIQSTLNPATNEEIRLDNVEYFYGLGSQEEYLPVNLYENKDYYETRSHDILLVNGNGVITDVYNESSKLEFKFEGDGVVELPRIYYIGYTLKDGNNKIKLYENDKGFIEAKLNSGTYSLEYEGTNLYKASIYISIISIIGLGVFVWKRK